MKLSVLEQMVKDMRKASQEVGCNDPDVEFFSTEHVLDIAQMDQMDVKKFMSTWETPDNKPGDFSILMNIIS